MIENLEGYPCLWKFLAIYPPPRQLILFIILPLYILSCTFYKNHPPCNDLPRCFVELTFTTKKKYFVFFLEILTLANYYIKQKHQTLTQLNYCVFLSFWNEILVTNHFGHHTYPCYHHTSIHLHVLTIMN